jgi:Protein of unknown function (DUF2917)
VPVKQTKQERPLTEIFLTHFSNRLAQRFRRHEVSVHPKETRSAIITRTHQHLETSGAVRVLRFREVLRLDNAAGTSLRILRGSVWITQEGDQKDHYLPATGTITLDRTGLALVQALEPAELILWRPVSQVLPVRTPAARWTAPPLPANKAWKT